MLEDAVFGALIAFGIAVFTTPVGVSGAVFLVPVQVSVLHTPSPAVTPTNLLYNLIAIPGALLRFHRLHRAVVALQENTFAIGLFLEREAAPVRGQPGELLDEIEFAQSSERRQPRHFCIAQTHFARPAVASRAASTFQEDRHVASFSKRVYASKHALGATPKNGQLLAKNVECTKR